MFDSVPLLVADNAELETGVVTDDVVGPYWAVLISMSGESTVLADRGSAPNAGSKVMPGSRTPRTYLGMRYRSC